jgi:4'-phosphopantetheinyl transferase EntD
VARQLKTPKQRAQEALDRAKHREEFLAGKVKDAKQALEDLERAHRVAVRRRQHAEASPDLLDEDDTELPFDEEKP